MSSPPEAREVLVPRDAATVMLVRDDPELQVFMLRRNFDSVWIAGASVFPGGAIDDDDRDLAWETRTRGVDDAAASAAFGLERGGLAFFVGAIRETFEEAGVLLAHGADGAAADGRFEHLVDARTALNSGTTDFATFVADHDLVLATDELHVFSNWVTPPGSPRRYDTWFFVAEAPPGTYEHDNLELIESAWIRPADALAAFDRGEMDLIYPTQKSLEALTEFETASALLAALAPPTRAEPAERAARQRAPRNA